MIASCSQKIEKRLIGEWALESNPGEMYMEFFEDNTFLIPDSSIGCNSGKWIILYGSWLKLENPGNGVHFLA